MAGIALCAAAMLTAVAVNAQNRGKRPANPPTSEEMATRMTERMTKVLDLSDEQQKAVYQMNLDQINAMQAQRKENFEKKQGEMDARREEMKARREARDAKLKELLTPDQYTKWKEMEQQRPPRGPQGDGGPGEGGFGGPEGGGPGGPGGFGEGGFGGPGGGFGGGF